ncbi:MAG: hypothetical protein JSS07_10740 [Proteobacteria bacterium]|nr:hypothetical protein [Pseudomonadota bacterium]
MPHLNPEAIDFRVASGFFLKKRKLNDRDLEVLQLIVDYQGKKVPTIGGIILFSARREEYFPNCWYKQDALPEKIKAKLLIQENFMIIHLRQLKML